MPVPGAAGSAGRAGAGKGVDVPRRAILLALAVVVAVGVGAGIALISTHGGERPSSTQRSATGGNVVPSPRALHFTSRTTKSAYIDNTRKGLSAGDVLTQHSVWYEGKDRAGTMAVTSTVTRRTSAQTGEVMFTAVATTNQGQIVMTGSFDIVPQNQTFEAAVTGGTRGFRGARGQAVFQQTSGTTTQVTLLLSS